MSRDGMSCQTNEKSLAKLGGAASSMDRAIALA